MRQRALFLAASAYFCERREIVIYFFYFLFFRIEFTACQNYPELPRQCKQQWATRHIGVACIHTYMGAASISLLDIIRYSSTISLKAFLSDDYELQKALPRFLKANGYKCSILSAHSDHFCYRQCFPIFTWYRSIALYFIRPILVTFHVLAGERSIWAIRQ